MNTCTGRLPVVLATFAALLCLLPPGAFAADAGQPIRLAVIEYPISKAKDAHDRAALLDLIIARISTIPGFETVERAKLEAALREIALSSSQSTGDAIRIGQMVKADWCLMVSFPHGSTNTVVGKIVDAATGVIRDLQVTDWGPNKAPGTAEVFVNSLVATRSSPPQSERRHWIGFGAFEDLGLYNRYPNFGEQLRLSMTRKYAGSRVSVVERNHVTPLLEEMELTTRGYSTSRSNKASAQPAFVLVDGLYQAFRDTEDKINVVLRMKWVGGRTRAVTITELPGAALEATVGEAIDAFLASSPLAGTNSTAQKVEIRTQIERGQRLAGLAPGFALPPAGPLMYSVRPKDRVGQMREAVSALESALLLNPDSLNAKFYLAACLMDPILDQVERGRNYWREIIATSTNVYATANARLALAQSYIDSDNMQAVELLTSIRNQLSDPNQRSKMNSTLRNARAELERTRKLSSENIIEFATDAWRTECQVAELAVQSGKRLSVGPVFEWPRSWFFRAFHGTTNAPAQREYTGIVVSNLIREFPKFEPYLVASHARNDTASSPWRAWYLRTLSACEEKPDAILDPVTYYSDSLRPDLANFVRRKEFNLAERVVRVFEKEGRSRLFTREQRDEVDFLRAHVYVELKRWDQAIAILEAIGPRQASVEDPFWGEERFISGNRAAAFCRKLGGMPPKVPASGAPIQVESALPVEALPGGEITFIKYGGDLWMTDRVGFYRYRPAEWKLEKVISSVNPKSHGMAILDNRIWSTSSDGLYAFNPVDRSTTSNTMAHGLTLSNSTAVLADRDRLWIGFGGRKGGRDMGALGYLNVRSNHFVGLMSELQTVATRDPNERTLRRSRVVGDNTAIGRWVTDIEPAGPDALWIAADSHLFHYHVRSNKWQEVVPDLRGAVFNKIAAGEHYVALPSREPSGWSSADTNFGGLVIYDVRKNTHRRVLDVDGFPNNVLSSALIEGTKAWVGGNGFLAVVDLPTACVEKVCPLTSSHGVQSLLMDGPHLWFTSGPGLYRIPKDFSPDPSRPTMTLPGPGPNDEIRDINTARALLKQAADLLRIYGTKEGTGYREVMARFRAFARAEAASFPLFEPVDRAGSNRFINVTMNRDGRTYDGFRFRNTLDEPADIGWIFAHGPAGNLETWFITPMEDARIDGFTDSSRPQVRYTNAPWKDQRVPFNAHLQFLHNGQLQPGKEYLIWFNFRQARPVQMYVAFDLFAATDRNRSVRVLEERFGLTGEPFPGVR